MSVVKVTFDDRINKPKKVLALNEKVAAIRRYEVDPVYTNVGRHFHCSPDQIKRIIKQKNEILAEWNNRTRKPVIYTTHSVKTVKMSFLGRAVYEWIRRMMYYSDFILTDALIMTMCLEFKREMYLKNFSPTKAWIRKFRQLYNLKHVNTGTLDIGYHESHSVQVRDIVRHLQTVCGSESEIKEEEEENYPEGITADEPMLQVQHTNVPSCSSNVPLKQNPLTKHIELRPSLTPVSLLANVKSEPIENVNISFCARNPPLQHKPATAHVELRPTVIPVSLSVNPEPIESFNKPSCSSNPPLEEEPVTTHVELRPTFTPAILPVKPEPVEVKVDKAAESPKIVINTYEEAIKCVKLLEDLALLKENFRLIGLIERLEEALKAKK